jgi:predicted CXXCH cytochrome family protein
VTRKVDRVSRAAAALMLVLAVAFTGGFSVGRATRAADDAGFPHVKHGKLFPTCGGCHAGISTGDSVSMFPSAGSCKECHNGDDVKSVAWVAAPARPTNLRFDHARHAQSTDSAGTRTDCTRCHGDGPSVKNAMLVARARPETCIGCHAHEAPSHLAPSSRCATCHVPLSRATTLSDSAVGALPKPTSHTEPDFISTHGVGIKTETCATCHSRESCARCHVNAQTLAPIVALGSDARIARLVKGRTASYAIPSSHRQSDFANAHGALAQANAQTCATCHAQPSCRACHTGSLGARTINGLPRGEQGRPVGVQLRPPPMSLVATSDTLNARVVRVHSSDFTRTHGPAAATKRLDCAGCHQQSFCASCHQGSGQRRFHVTNFVSRHASESYARETKCASCHNAEVFCRSCHRDVAGIGAGSKRRAGTAHAGQPLWLLQHGEAARRGMPGCAGCHQQTDCMQCHSAFGGRVNPHGPDFNAKEMQKRNPTLCSYCHIGPPR